MLERHVCSHEQLGRIVVEMQSGDKIIQYILKADNAIKPYYKQIIVQIIIDVKK